jgi:excisionase family DNA binding protein
MTDHCTHTEIVTLSYRDLVYSRCDACRNHWFKRDDEPVPVTSAIAVLFKMLNERDDPDRLLHTPEIAHACGVTIRTVINWVSSGKLQCVRTVGGHLRFRVSDLEAARALQKAFVGNRGVRLKDDREDKPCPACGLSFKRLDLHKCRPKSTQPNTPPPLCACGCGEEVGWNHTGTWSQWRSGHHKRGTG